MDVVHELGAFAGKLLLLIVFLAAAAAILARASGRARPQGAWPELEVMALSDELQRRRESLTEALASDGARTALEKLHRRRRKARDKAPATTEKKPRLLVADFHGDLRASAVESLRHEITAILQVAETGDEVLLRLESPGGMVHGYGLAASQLARVRERGVRLTVAVDKVAASGGYMMACVADRIVAAPFAVIGSIGVVMQMPNFHRLLREKHVDFELLTAGEYKRTLTLFGENTEAARTKALEELQETHDLFKDFIARFRPHLDLATVANGEHWFGTRALDLGLVDEIRTSDDYLLERAESHRVFLLRSKAERSWLQRLGERFASLRDEVRTPLARLP